MFYIINRSRQHAAFAAIEGKMPYQMNHNEADQYALRMFNDDYWEKTYSPALQNLKLKEDIEYGTHVEVPVVLTTERDYVGDDDSEEYKDRPNAVDEELAQDDQGIITIPCIIAIPYPIDLSKCDLSDSAKTIAKLRMEVKEIGLGTMYEGEIKLSLQAKQHLITRIGTEYILIDTLDQNKDLLKSVVDKAPSLKLDENSIHSIFA